MLACGESVATNLAGLPPDRQRVIRMPIQVLMPALSPTMEKGNLAKWHKKEGDAVKSGDVIAEIETDKATMEVEAVDEGTLGRILVPEGTNDVAVNTPIAMILGGRRGRHPHSRRQAARAQQGDRSGRSSAGRIGRAATSRKPTRLPRPRPAPVRARERRPKPTCRKAQRW